MTLKNDVDNWIGAKTIFHTMLLHSSEKLKKFSVKNLKSFTELITLENAEKYQYFLYKIKHKSGWTYSNKFIRLSHIEDADVIFLQTFEKNGKPKEYWYYKKTMEWFNDFNNIF